MALSRRIALTALTATTAVIATLALPATMAAAADPITGTNGPTLTAPSDTHRVVLSWTPSAGSTPYLTGYELQISPNADWTNDTVSLPNGGRTSNHTYEVPISLPHGYYYWRVRAVDAGGQSNWSADGQFLREWTDPMTMLQEPTSSDPTIAWAPVPGASLYEVRYSTQPNFPTDASLTATCWTASTEFTPYTLKSSVETVGGDCMSATDIKDGLSLYWEVRAFDDSTAPILPADTANDPNYECAQVQPECDADTLNSVQLFDASQIGSPTFTYSAPAAGSPTPGPVTGLTTSWFTDIAHSVSVHDCDDLSASICPVTPTFSWNPISGANYYEVAIYRDPALSNVYRVYDTQWPSITPRDAYLDAQVNDGTGAAFYWTVTAETCVNSNTDATCGTPVLVGSGGGGGSGGTPTFTVVGASPAPATFDKRSGAVTVTSPNPSTHVNSSTGTFTWGDFFASGGQSAFDVRNYRLQVATDAEFSHVVLDVATIDMHQYTPQSVALADGVYYWRVQPIDESGNGLTWSNTLQFTRDATPPVFRLTDTSVPLVGAKFHLAVSETDLAGSVSTSTVQIVPIVGGGSALPGSWAVGATTGTWVFTTTAKLVPGQYYGIHLNSGITDSAGNAAKASSHTARASVVADDNSGVWSFNTGAARHTASGAIGGTYVTLPSARGASVHFVGSKYYVYGCKGPSYAKLVVTLDGHTITTVNEHQSFTKCGVLLFTGSSTTTAVHTLKVVASGGTATIDEMKTA